MPGLLVLAAGLAGGVLVFRRVAKRSRRSEGFSDRDLELEIADLRTRREDLYRRLRGETGEELSMADRGALELAAARTLRDLDLAESRLEKGRQRKPKGKSKKTKDKRRPRREGGEQAAEAAQAAVERPAPAGWMSRRPILAGFLLGSGMVAVVAALLYWAVQDARPGPPPPPAPRGASPPAPSETPHPERPLPPQAEAELSALDSRLEANPGDLQALKERALLWLRHERFVEAFRDSELILEALPGDIDGVYVQGVVRLAMGQDEAARVSFDRVLELFPEHFQAMTWLGILEFRSGNFDAAIASWEGALAVTGGSQPEIQNMIAEARRAADAQGAQPAPGDETTSPPAQAMSEQTAVPEAYAIRVGVGAGQRIPAGGILFLAVRDGGGGPPIAVKRIDRPVFPLDAVIGEQDSMTGQPLPRSATVTARLDADGSASTRSPADLEAAALAEVGDTVELVLRGGQ